MASPLRYHDPTGLTKCDDLGCQQWAFLYGEARGLLDMASSALAWAAGHALPRPPLPSDVTQLASDITTHCHGTDALERAARCIDHYNPIATIRDSYINGWHAAQQGCWVDAGHHTGPAIAQTITIIDNLRIPRPATPAAANTAGLADDAVAGACAGGSCGIPGKTCFVAGTLIRTERGDIPIEQVVVGDKVWSRNLDTGKDELQPVVETYVRHADALLKLSVAGAVLTTTADHPFMVKDRGWVKAGDLRVGDVLVTPTGTTVLAGFEHVRPRRDRVQLPSRRQPRLLRPGWDDARAGSQC